MIGINRVILAAIFFGATGTTVTADDGFSGVRQAVENYFNATEFGDPALLRETFSPSFEIQFVAPDGTLGRITADDYIGHIIEGRKANRKGRIISIDVTGNAATVKAEIDMGKRVYTDYLFLLRLGEGWRIANKIATYRTKKVAQE